MADGTLVLASDTIRDQGRIILHEVPEPAAWQLAAILALFLAPLKRLLR